MHMHGIYNVHIYLYKQLSNLLIMLVLLLICLFRNQHFAGCTGYGHDEAGGREALDQAFAEIVGAESALVRSQVCNMLPSFSWIL